MVTGDKFTNGKVLNFIRLGVAGHTLFEIEVTITGVVNELRLRNLHSS